MLPAIENMVTWRGDKSRSCGSRPSDDFDRRDSASNQVSSTSSTDTSGLVSTSVSFFAG